MQFVAYDDESPESVRQHTDQMKRKEKHCRYKKQHTLRNPHSTHAHPTIWLRQTTRRKIRFFSHGEHEHLAFHRQAIRYTQFFFSLDDRRRRRRRRHYSHTPASMPYETNQPNWICVCCFLMNLVVVGVFIPARVRKNRCLFVSLHFFLSFLFDCYCFMPFRLSFPNANCNKNIDDKIPLICLHRNLRKSVCVCM